jgi:hypothetical protein
MGQANTLRTPSLRAAVPEGHVGEATQTPTVGRLPTKIMSSVFENFISGNGHVKSKETI